MGTGTTTPYNVILKTKKTNLVDFSKLNPGAINDLTISDSIFSFFPYAEFSVNDSTGSIIDNLTFIEGEEFTLKVGKDFIDYLTAEYVWFQNSMDDSTPGNFISGVNTFKLISTYYMKDRIRSKSYGNQRISYIADIIAFKEYGVLSYGHISNVTNTTESLAADGSTIWYQFNEQYSSFIQRLATCAHTHISTFNPFYTFINSKGDFYFSSLEDLFTKQISIGIYRFESSKYEEVDDYIIKNYKINFLGLETNKKLYKVDIYNTSNTGLSEVNSMDIKDAVSLKKELLAKTLIKRDFKLFTQDYKYIGIQNDPFNDSGFIAGRENGFYQNACLSYTMSIQVAFNTNAVSGRILTLKVKSPIKGDSTEFSADWLIVESVLSLDENGLPFQDLVIARPALNVDIRHLAGKDFD